MKSCDLAELLNFGYSITLTSIQWHMTLESHSQNMHTWIGNIHLIETIISQTITTAVTVTPWWGITPTCDMGDMCDLWDLMTLRAWTPLWIVSAGSAGSGALHCVTVQHWLTLRWSGWPLARCLGDHWAGHGPHLSPAWVPGQPRPQPLPPSPGSHWPGRGSPRSLLSPRSENRQMWDENVQI